MLVTIQGQSVYVEILDDFRKYIPDDVFQPLQEWLDWEKKKTVHLYERIEALEEKLREWEMDDSYYNGFSEGRDVGFDEGYKQGREDVKNGRRTRRIRKGG